jgi:hypothetical protein
VWALGLRVARRPQVYAYGTLSADREVAGRLFEGEEAVLHVMGDQIASKKRRKGWTLGNGRRDGSRLVLPAAIQVRGSSRSLRPDLRARNAATRGHRR